MLHTALRTSVKGHLEITDPRTANPFVKSELTRKDYLTALRNKLYVVDEQLWMQEYTKSRSGGAVQPLPSTQSQKLLAIRKGLVDEHPITKLRADLANARQRNMTHAAQYLEELTQNVYRQLPTPLIHVNQIAGKVYIRSFTSVGSPSRYVVQR
jgi:hypothetical protein